MNNSFYHRRGIVFGLFFGATLITIIALYYKTVHVQNVQLSSFFSIFPVDKINVRKDYEGHISGDELLNDLVVVTGISSDHYNESLDMLGSVHHFLPNTSIILYDVGLKSEQVKALKELKNIEIRHYEFEAKGRTDYRKLGYTTKGLGCYAWKVFVMDEISKEHKIFLWLDASIRILKPLTTDHCIESVNDIPFTAGSSHLKDRRMIEFTNEGTVKYFNITRQQMKDVVGFESNCLMFKMTKKMRLIMEKWVDCAYHEECICGTKSGTDKESCDTYVPISQGTKFVGCHRYDQATLTWLLALYLGMDKVDKVVNSNCKVVFSVHRYVTNDWRKFLVKKREFKGTHNI